MLFSIMRAHFILCLICILVLQLFPLEWAGGYYIALHTGQTGIRCWEGPKMSQEKWN